MRKLVVGSVLCLFGTVLLGAAPVAATTTTLFSSSTPGVVGSPPVVPAGICKVTITAEGGRGGMYDGFTDVPGGAGASVTARIGVSPGDTLDVLVGGAGGTGGGDKGALAGDGGIGGGGGGGYGAPGGGGASVVWAVGPTPLVVAGAGGGANGQFSGGAGGLLGQPGGDGGTNGIGGVGPRSGKGGQANGTGGVGGGGSLDYAGGGGGGVGTGGAAGDNSPPNRDGGPGGTGNGTVGGAGGSGGGSGANGTAGGTPPGSGTGGAGYTTGGTGISPGGNAGAAPATAGGGGGGGIGFGGGGGAGSGPSGGSAGGGAGYGAGGGASGDGGGGGGGGSSYVIPSALSSSSVASTRTGHGQVTITYDPVADACPDTTDPTVDLRTPADGATHARGATVIADFDCADTGGSGLASCVGTVADGAAISTSTLGAHTFTVTATDGADNDLAVTHDYEVVDATDPTVDLRTPPEAATYAQGQVVLADYDCADEVGGSGLTSCVGTAADGAAIDTSTAGEHQFTVTATDGAGNDHAVTHGYTVLDPPRPDGRIRKGATGPLGGDGVYNATGTGQTRSGAAVRGASVTYFVSVQNDSLSPDTLEIDGTASTARFRVRYLRGTTDITAAVVAGTYATSTLAPGAARVIKVVVTVRNTAPRGARLTGLLSASSGAVADTVKFVTSRAPA